MQDWWIVGIINNEVCRNWKLSLTEANTLKQVAVVMGSDSDLKTLQPAVEILEQFGISNEVRILSAHRTPKEMMDFAQNAESNGFGVIIAGAATMIGMEQGAEIGGQMAEDLVKECEEDK